MSRSKPGLLLWAGWFLLILAGILVWMEQLEDVRADPPLRPSRPIDRVTPDVPQRATILPGGGDSRPSSPSPTPTRISVLDRESNAPVPVATVRFTAEDGAPAGADREAILSRQTNAMGVVALHLPGTSYGIRVSAEGYASTRQRCVFRGAEVIVRLSRPAALRGVVVARGTGVAGASVTVATEFDETCACVTTDDGSFRLDGLHPGTAEVRVTTSNFAEGRSTEILSAGEESVTRIELVAGASIHGVVVDGLESPVTGARVRDSREPARWVESDGEGRFELHRLRPASEFELHCTCPGYSEAVSLVRADSGDVVVCLSRAGAVMGTIMGAPRRAVVVATASHRARGRRTLQRSNGTVGESGQFVVEGLATDVVYTIHVHVPGDTLGRLAVRLARPVSAGETLQLGTLVLPRGYIVKGLVTDEIGNGVERTRVSISGWSHFGFRFDGHAFEAKGQELPERIRLVTNTDGTGRFRFSGLARGSYTVVVHSPAAPAPSTASAIVEDRNIEDLHLRVRSGREIHGQLVAALRAPRVRLDKFVVLACDDRGYSSLARVRPDGRFCVQRLEDGSYTLESIRSPSGFCIEPLHGVRAGARNVALRVVPAARIEGVVRDARGSGVRADLYLRNADGRESNASFGRTDESGAFALTVPPSFSGVLVARAKGKRNLKGECIVAAGAEGVAITVRR